MDVTVNVEVVRGVARVCSVRTRGPDEVGPHLGCYECQWMRR